MFLVLSLVGCRPGCPALGLHPDADGDGFGDPDTSVCEGGVRDASDCDDTRNRVHPGAKEVCDQYDQDCDGEVDESAVNAETFWEDADGDGVGGVSFEGCRQGGAPPPGLVEQDGDCDDFDPAVSPLAEEVCDGVDQDCDGAVDEDFGVVEQYIDADGDGYGGASVEACFGIPAYVLSGGDCDDGDPALSPGAAELCNGIDDDCDGEIDLDSADYVEWYMDGDGDGYGAGTGALQCGPDFRHPAPGGDCDDTDATVHPGAAEDWPDTVDQNCDAYGNWLVSADAEVTIGTGWHTVATAGDQTGDGVPDLLVGWPERKGSSGRAYVFAAPVESGDTSDAYAAVDGGGSYAGWGIAGLGDIDGDGQDDIAVGSPGQTYGVSESWVRLYFGPVSGTVPREDAAATWTGAGPFRHAGAVLTPIGDQDGDGLPEVVVGNGGNSDAPGVVYLLCGAQRGDWTFSDACARLPGESDKDYAGVRIATGNFDGDGIDDLAIGAPLADLGAEDAGAVYVLHGPVNHRDLADAQSIVAGSEVGEEVGFGLAALGDQDGDGLDDLGIAHGSDEGGELCVLSPRDPGTLSLTDAEIRLSADNRTHIYWPRVATGDFDGDQVLDIAIGQTWDGNLNGTVDLVMGPLAPGTWSVLDLGANIHGDEWDTFGSSLVFLDISDDGIDDLVVGSGGDGVYGFYGR